MFDTLFKKDTKSIQRQEYQIQLSYILISKEKNYKINIGKHSTHVWVTSCQKNQFFFFAVNRKADCVTTAKYFDCTQQNVVYNILCNRPHGTVFDPKVLIFLN